MNRLGHMTKKISSVSLQAAHATCPYQSKLPSGLTARAATWLRE
uniref:Uncharacterized protein n=1 Tax=Arundo donax TaxID=35708 RepID=A0A0A9FJ12_ARUDO